MSSQRQPRRINKPLLSDRDFSPHRYQLLEPRKLLAGDVCFVGDLAWAPLSVEVAKADADRTHINATDVSLFDLQETRIQRTLALAPVETAGGLSAKPVTLSIPNPNGEFERFSIVESSILEPELAAKFPDIKTYRGQGIENPASTIRLDFTVQGFHAQVLAPDNGDYYIDPYFHLETDVYASYFVHDTLSRPDNHFHEIGVETHHHVHDFGQDFLNSEEHKLHDHVDGKPCTCDKCLAIMESLNRNPGDDSNASGNDENDSGSNIAPPFGEELRTYQLAVAATGEYTQFHGGTVAGGMSAIVTTMNRVNGLYENDLGVRMVLVGNNDSLIYTNGNTDPYSNNNGGAMLGENQANIDNVIGDANYDIGHVFSTGGGGIAGLGVVGRSGNKARGVTGLPSPIGDPFDVDFVAHEIGHQYGGNHTFNGDSGSCAGGNRNGSTAYEPGSGSSIQAYAGICGNDNLQSNSDAMFHSLSIDEIRAYVTTGVGNSSATITSTGNNEPTVDAGPDYVIPAGTPFELTAVGSDADAGNVLTYSWEQRDLGPQQDVNGGDNGSSPIFRTFDPTVDATRSFPRAQDLANNTTSVGETLPTTDRTMNFRVVVRDNASGGGGVVSDDMTVDVNPTGSSFSVTSQNNATTWQGGTQETITWNVAGTTANGIDTANVDIFFSNDGGLTFDTLLASGVPNDGSHEITVPGIETTDGRIKVKGAGNIFFDINNSDITIEQVTAGVRLTQSDGSTRVVENGATDSYEVRLNTVPAGTVSLSATADDQTELSLDGTNYSSSVAFDVSDTSPVQIFVRAIDDADEEGAHNSTITHAITATGDATDYPTSTSIPNIDVVVIDDDLVIPVFVGIDFDVAAGSSPSNWSRIGANSNGTASNLIGEDGEATSFDLSITETGGSWDDFAATPIASTIPQHSVDLTNIDGQIYTGADSIEFVWSDLNPLLNYEIYVLAVEGFYDSIQQTVTIVGDTTVSFEQRFDQDMLFINDQLGSSSSSLSDYAVVVNADSSGEISITIDAIAGTEDVVAGGLAIAEIPNRAPTAIVLSNDEIAENTDTSSAPYEIGVLSATDSDSNTFTYSLVPGTGDADNIAFSIDGSSLRINQGVMVDYESKSEYLIRVQVSDGIDTFEQEMSVAVIDQAESSTFTIGSGTTQRSMLTSLEVAFDGLVTFGATPFELIRRGADGGVVDITPTVDNSSGSTVVTLTFAGTFTESSGSLVDGNYQLTIFGDQVQTISGQDFDGDGDGIAGGNFVFGDTEADQFFRLFGDLDGNRFVNIFDLLSFRRAYLSEDGDDDFDVNFDSNLDGRINVFDLLRFRQNWLERVDFE